MPVYETRSKPEFMPRDVVKSHFRAGWTGEVWECKRGGDGFIVQCLIFLDRNGRPVRKPFKSEWLSQNHLTLVRRNPYHDQIAANWRDTSDDCCKRPDHPKAGDRVMFNTDHKNRNGHLNKKCGKVVRVIHQNHKISYVVKADDYSGWPDYAGEHTLEGRGSVVKQ